MMHIIIAGQVRFIYTCTHSTEILPVFQRVQKFTNLKHLHLLYLVMSYHLGSLKA